MNNFIKRFKERERSNNNKMCVPEAFVVEVELTAINFTVCLVFSTTGVDPERAAVAPLGVDGAAALRMMRLPAGVCCCSG